MSIHSEISTDGGELTIFIEGRFALTQGQEFREACNKIDVYPKFYIVDMKNVTFIDDFAIVLLSTLIDYVGGDVSKISIINYSADIKKRFNEIKFDQLFIID